jgi:hypothetical protein
MEYVKGEPITDYCDKARLSVKERLRLFVQVCQAVQHAHQKGIIHRDLKPSNILVCPYDGQPVPKVIDFGLAKAMHQPLTEHSLYTAHGVMVGTPLYMSPEQAETNNLDIDTRSDLYSLGVILYELLTGSTPLEKRQIQDAAWQEMLRLIQELEPPKPSTRLSGSGSLPTIAAQRNLEPAQLSRAVRGDLDWIVMKTLEKDRSRRYETANGLARDIERYLHDDPVEARPPSAGYRFRKFARRNKGALFTVGLVAAALVVGTVVSTWQAIRATRAERVAQDERREADRQRAQADANFRKAKAAVDKYFTLVSESTLFDVPGLQPLRKELLEAALQFYKSSAVERTNDPTVLADLAVTYMRVSQVSHTVDRNDDAIAAIDRALEVIDRLRRDFPQARDQRRRLAGFWKGYRPTYAGTDGPKDAKAALHTLSRMVDTLDQLSREHPDEPAFLADLAAACYHTGQHLSAVGQRAQAIPYWKRGKTALEQLVGDVPDNPEYRADLARICGQSAFYLPEGAVEAEAECRQAVSLLESLVTEFPQSPHYRTELGIGLRQYARHTRQRNPIEAKKASLRGLDLAASVDREYPGVPRYLSEFSDATMDALKHGHTADALAALEDRIAETPADELRRHGFARLVRDVAIALPQNGEFRSHITRLHRRALELFQNLARDFPDNPTYRKDLGYAARSLAGATDAIEELVKSLAVAVEAFETLATAKIDQRGGQYRSEHADSLNWLSAGLSQAGRIQEAAQAQQRSADSYETLAREFPTQAWRYLQIFPLPLGALSERLAAAGRHAEADAVRQRLIKLAESFLAEQPKDRQAREWRAFAVRSAAISLHNQSAEDPCEQILRKALALYTELANEFPDDPSHADHKGHLLKRLSWVVGDKGQTEEARTNLEQAADIFEKLAADKIPQRDGHYLISQADSLGDLSRLLSASDANEAAAVARRHVDVCRTLVNNYAGNLQYRQKLATGLGLLAERLATVGETDEAEAARNGIIEVLDYLIAQQPEDRQAREQLAYALNQFAWNLVTAREVDPALAALAVRAAQRAADAAPHEAMFVNTLSVAQYRAGNWAGVVKSAELTPDKSNHYNGFFVAMAHWKLGNKDGAHQWYEKAAEWMEKYQPQNGDLVRFRAEAEEQLGITQPSPTPNVAPQGDVAAKPES